MDCSLPGSFVHGLLQARILEWIAIAFSRKDGVQFSLVLSCVQLLATPWTAAHQTSLSMDFFRQNYWCRLPFPPPADLPDPGIKPTSSVSLTLAVGLMADQKAKNLPAMQVTRVNF